MEEYTFGKGYKEGWDNALYSIARDLHDSTCDAEKFRDEDCFCLSYVEESAKNGWIGNFNDDEDE